MENISLPPLLNDEIAKMAIKELLQFAKEEVKRELEAERLPINQKDLCKLCGELLILSLSTCGYLRESIKKLSNN
mgnify:CR=1 FL=1